MRIAAPGILAGMGIAAFGGKEQVRKRCQTNAASALMLAVGFLLFIGFGSPLHAQCSGNCSRIAEASNMDLVGYNDLQGRSAYMPVIQKQGDRWIAYIGHHVDNQNPRQVGGVQRAEPLNALTGKLEPNGTSIVDVTDPRRPKYLAHIPGAPKGHSQENQKFGLIQNPILGGGAQYVRTCSGKDLPHADKSKFYLLRAYGQVQWEIWDVTDPSKPARIQVIVEGLHDTHKPWWECETGIAYLVGGPNGWRVPPVGTKAVHDVVNHALIYDLSNPAKPKLIREFGLSGQEPGSTGPLPLGGLHNILSSGPTGNRVYLTYGNNSHGVLQVLDREKLLNGPKEPTPENLRYPEVARIDLPPDIGAHTAVPLRQILVPEFVKQKEGKVRDFIALIGQVNGVECRRGTRQMMYMFDVTTESRPLGVASWTVEEASGNFCSRGGRFGLHSAQENFTDIYHKRVLFITSYNAGVRAVDIRDPYHPKEIGYYIPAVTDLTDESCAHESSGVAHCTKAVQTNNVEVDDRGFIYITDRANTGMHILELTGPARTMANFTRTWFDE